MKYVEAASLFILIFRFGSGRDDVAGQEKTPAAVHKPLLILSDCLSGRRTAHVWR